MLNSESGIANLVSVLLLMNRKALRFLFVAYGLVLALILFIVNREINPHEGLWFPLIGAIAGTQVFGYFIAWKPFVKQRLHPFYEDIMEQLAEQLHAEATWGTAPSAVSEASDT